MRGFPLAVISDIHGNSFALSAVLKEIQRRKISRIINLGDTFYGPLDPEGTCALLSDFPDMIHIRGDSDRLFLEEPSDNDNKTIRSMKSKLTTPIIHMLSKMRPFYADAMVYACHGTPASDEKYLLEQSVASVPMLKPITEISDALKRFAQPFILCGHSHLCRVVCLPESMQLVINPGSVGLPAYSYTESAGFAAEPLLHKIESGSPAAQFSIIDHRENFSIVKHIPVIYDWEAAAEMAEQNDRPDWAFALRTGKVL